MYDMQQLETLDVTAMRYYHTLNTAYTYHRIIIYIVTLIRWVTAALFSRGQSLISMSIIL